MQTLPLWVGGVGGEGGVGGVGAVSLPYFVICDIWLYIYFVIYTIAIHFVL